MGIGRYYVDVKELLESDVWTNYVSLELLDQINIARDLLMSLPSERPEVSDDFLRGRVSGLVYALEHWKQVLDEVDANRNNIADDPLLEAIPTPEGAN